MKAKRERALAPTKRGLSPVSRVRYARAAQLRNSFRNRVARADRTRLTGDKPRLVGAHYRSRFALMVFLPRQSPVKNIGLMGVSPIDFRNYPDLFLSCCIMMYTAKIHHFYKDFAGAPKVFDAFSHIFSARRQNA